MVFFDPERNCLQLSIVRILCKAGKGNSASGDWRLLFEKLLDVLDSSLVDGLKANRSENSLQVHLAPTSSRLMKQPALHLNCGQ